MIKILIVGGSGFLGRECLQNLLAYDVTVVGRQFSCGLIEPQNHKYYQLDINNSAAVENFLERHSYSHLIYLAWPLTPPHDSLEHIYFSTTSLDFITRFIRKNSHSRIVIAGSIHEVGISCGLVSNDFKNAVPTNLYGISKKYVYDCIRVFLRSKFKNNSFCWVRFSNIYGSLDHANKFITTVICNELEKKIVSINNPDLIVDFVNIKDAAKGMCLALFDNYDGVINIGAGKGYFLKDIYKFITLHVEKEILQKNLFTIEPQYDSKNGAILDVTVALKTLQYIPEVSIEKGILECILFLIRNKLKKNESN